MHVLEINALQVIMRNVAGLELVNQLSRFMIPMRLQSRESERVMGRHQYRDTLITKGRDSSENRWKPSGPNLR